MKNIDYPKELRKMYVGNYNMPKEEENTQ